MKKVILIKVGEKGDKERTSEGPEIRLSKRLMTAGGGDGTVKMTAVSS